MRRLLGWVVVMVMISRSAVGQTDSEKVNRHLLYSANKWIDKAFNKFDTTYVKRLPNKFVLVLKSSNWLDSYDVLIDEKSALELRSDLSYNIGLTFGYKFLLFNYAVNLSNNFAGQTVGSEEWDLHLNLNYLGINLYSFSNNGNTNISSIRGSNFSNRVNESFSGLNTQSFWADAYYYFNKRRYSNSAAYSNNHRIQQHKSAGSFIAGFSYSKQQLYFDFNQLPEKKQFVDLKELGEQFNKYNSYTISVGYGYNWVFSKRWLTNLSFIPSFGINDYHENSSSEGDNFSMNTKVMGALVYNKPRYFWGVSSQYYTNWYFSDSYTLSSSLGTFNVSYGFRF